MDWVHRLGYGIVSKRAPRLTDSGTFLAHRVAYELLVGPVEPGLHLDHLCRIRNCVRPEHLEPVTPAENTRRGLHGVLRTHCQNGHALTPDNVSIRNCDNSKRCKQCLRDEQAARRAKWAPPPEFCSNGHRMAGDNLKPDGARWTCRECARKSARDYVARKRLERAS